MDAQLEAIRIVTRCTSREQFVAMFNRYCSPTACFIPSTDTRPIGTATAFSVRLADGSMVLRGEGVVLDAWTHGNHRFKRPGLHLGIHRLDDKCGELFALLIDPGSTAVPIPPKTQLQMLLAASPSVVSEVETPTIEMPPLCVEIQEPRAPGSPIVLPANPLTDMNDDLVSAFVDCNLVAEDIDVVTVATMSVAISYSAPPIESSATIPTEIPHDPTTKTVGRDVIATLLGVAPMTKPVVFAASQPVPTELIDRVAHGKAAPLPQAPVVPTRPRQRISLAAVAPVTMVVRHRRSAARRIARAVINRMRRWWLPATVATTLVATALTSS
ncbi:MAG: hypothetical protein H0V17_24720 [Deltaproteobacteria bacterium]|nr:hypothetical protein [Deltaproteobacteria bacterium]